MKTPPDFASLAMFDGGSMGKPMTSQDISSLLAFSNGESPNQELATSGHSKNPVIVKKEFNTPMLPPMQNPMLMGFPSFPMKHSPPMKNESPPMPMTAMRPKPTMPMMMPQMPFPMLFPPMNPLMMPKLGPPPSAIPQADIPPSKAVVLQCPFPDCDLVWTKTKELYKHLREHHKTDFVCPYCKKQSTCMSNFVCHVRLHTNEKPWCCPLASCEYRGRTKNHSKSHVIQNHGIKFFHQYERFFLQDRCRKTQAQANPFSIPKSLFKRSASNLANTFTMAAMKKFQMGPGNFLNANFTPSPMSVSPPQLPLPPKIEHPAP